MLSDKSDQAIAGTILSFSANVQQSQQIAANITVSNNNNI